MNSQSKFDWVVFKHYLEYPINKKDNSDAYIHYLHFPFVYLHIPMAQTFASH